MSKFLYLPIEIGSRELNAKLLTAAAAAERGFSVLLGFQYHLFLNQAKLPAGLFFSKGCSRLFLQFVPAIRSSGHLFVASEEENFGYCLNDAPVSFNPSDLAENCDLYLCMGACEERFIEARYGKGFRKETPGNARVDALRPGLRSLSAPEAARIKDQYGRFVLLNMNFGLSNPNMKITYDQLFEIWVRGGIFRSKDPNEWVRQFEEFVHWELDNSNEMKALITLLAKKNHPVVIRPHPSEAADTWRTFVQQLGAPHIYVLEGTPLVPFMQAAELMVHPGCTTGMEAVVMGVPAVSINAGATKVPTYYVSPKVNPGAATAAEALNLIEAHFSGSDILTRQHPAHMAALSDYLIDLDSDTLTADRIAETLDRFSEKRAFGSDSRTLESVRWTTEPDGSNNFEANHKYRFGKFGVRLSDIDAALANFQTGLGRFARVRAREMYEGIYLIDSATA